MKKILILSCLVGSMVNLAIASITICNYTAHKMEIRTVVDGEERTCTLAAKGSCELKEYSDLSIILEGKEKCFDHLEDGSLIAFNEYTVGVEGNMEKTGIDFIQRHGENYKSKLFTHSTIIHG